MKPKTIDLLRSAGRIVLYGASSSGARAFHNAAFLTSADKISFFDSNIAKQGKEFCDRPVLTQQQFEALDKDTPIFISSTMYYEIEPMLHAMGFVNFHYDQGLLFSKKHFEKFEADFVRLLVQMNDQSNMNDDELYTLFHSARALEKIPGAFAEVGVYKGGSAFLLAAESRGKRLYLFDTFEGLPEKAIAAPSPVKGSEPTAGWLNDTDAETVRRHVLGAGIAEDQLVVKKGFFPETAADLTSEIFSLVHLDTDLYRTTLDALEFFYPRLSKGGRVVTHDYNASGCPGVKKAFQEYFGPDNLDAIIEVSESQAIAVK